MNLADLGYDAHFESAFGEVCGFGMVPARVTAEHRGKYSLRTVDGDMPGEPTGRLRYCTESREDFPAVGDWVTATVLDGGDRAVIHHVLPRRTEIRRKEAGNRYAGQVIAGNVDTVFIIQGLDGDFNIRRLERYLILALESGAGPVVLLSKSDLCSCAELKEKSELAEKVSAGFPVHSFSSLAGDGLDGVRRYVEPGKTVCFIGSSGAGKSTLINALAGEELLATASVRNGDSKGRHTTAARQMLFLPGGGIVIDTPGMREIGLLDESSASDAVFPEIAERAPECRYSDC
ncbi:MAG: ribosome small subunit-dependent GTPase A, partial [Candidatus Latescibacteria bacterium]|nr:ribosome small subunit-dependent GTPase A [Candidatus Latescibacterota bacterium]